jgi:hypothetical protein
VAIDESMRELPLPLRELEPVRLQLVAACVSIAQRLPFGDKHAHVFL